MVSEYRPVVNRPYIGGFIDNTVLIMARRSNRATAPGFEGPPLMRFDVRISSEPRQPDGDEENRAFVRLRLSKNP
jgi:hypothetical protein